MDASSTPAGLGLVPTFVSLAALPPGTRGAVVGVGSRDAPLTPIERRLLEFGFVPGEQIEIIAEARPGRDPFVVRIGHTTLALRRREAQSVWVDVQHSATVAPPQAHAGNAANGVELQHSATVAPPQAQAAASAQPHPAGLP